MTSGATRERPPSAIPWPPLLIAFAIIGGRALDHVFASPALPAFTALFGGGLVVLASASDVWCALTLRRHNTTIMPHRAVTALVTDGPYRYSRNPIYISHVVITLGLGLLLGSWGVVALTPFLGFALAKLSVRPEERHLREKFGAEFESYAARTPRWL